LTRMGLGQRNKFRRSENRASPWLEKNGLKTRRTSRLKASKQKGSWRFVFQRKLNGPPRVRKQKKQKNWATKGERWETTECMGAWKNWPGRGHPERTEKKGRGGDGAVCERGIVQKTFYDRRGVKFKFKPVARGKNRQQSEKKKADRSRQ